MANDLNLLQKLCNSYGVSGDEASVRDVILAEISPFATDIKVDNLGNVLAFKRGARRPAKKLLLSAHMDEVGFIVTHITDDGLLKFSAVGGIDANVTCGKSVVVGARKVPGVIGVKPVHLLSTDERQKSIPLDELYIDIGAASKEEALDHVSLGDSVCFPANFRLERNMVKSKAIDDRVGCFILVNLLKQDLPFDMHFTFVVQEEIGLRGQSGRGARRRGDHRCGHKGYPGREAGLQARRRRGHRVHGQEHHLRQGALRACVDLSEGARHKGSSQVVRGRRKRCRRDLYLPRRGEDVGGLAALPLPSHGVRHDLRRRYLGDTRFGPAVGREHLRWP